MNERTPGNTRHAGNIRADVKHPYGTGAPRGNKGRTWAIAVIILLVFAAAGLLYWYCTMQPGCTERVAAPAGITVSAQPHADKKIVMIDGTMIWIRRGGSITYSSTYETARTVKLEGEAYFKASENESAPFIIETGRLQISASGSGVDVTAGDSATTVALHDGRAEISARDGMKYSLKPGQQLVMDNTTNSAKIGGFPAGKLTDWRRENLQFDYLPLADIFDSLAKLYNIPFAYDAEKIGGDRYTLNLDGTETLEEVLAILSRISERFTYRVAEGTKVIITANNPRR